jgi:hypothetical protein
MALRLFFPVRAWRGDFLRPDVPATMLHVLGLLVLVVAVFLIPAPNPARVRTAAQGLVRFLVTLGWPAYVIGALIAWERGVRFTLEGITVWLTAGAVSGLVLLLGLTLEWRRMGVKREGRR